MSVIKGAFLLNCDHNITLKSTLMRHYSWRYRLTRDQRARSLCLPFNIPYGIVNGMELKIDKAGRIVVPKPLRERLGFRPETALEAIERPDGVLLKRSGQRPSIVKADGLWVHQGKAEPGARWEAALEDIREDRLNSVLKA